MARTPVLAAGGIVLRQGQTPLVAVVRLRKRNEWVLPKGKLDDGETPRAAAEREVMEETGHDVAVHEFLGTLVYESRGGSKVVHYWRMEARGGAVHELMRDVKAVDWLPLADAVDRLSRDYERAFLENVGPMRACRRREARGMAAGSSTAYVARAPADRVGFLQRSASSYFASVSRARCSRAAAASAGDNRWPSTRRRRAAPAQRRARRVHLRLPQFPWQRLAALRRGRGRLGAAGNPGRCRAGAP